MTLLIFLIFVLVCSAAVKMKFNIRMEEAIVSIIIAIILMTYILGLLSFMYLFVFVLIVTFIIAFKYLIENRQRIQIKEIFTLPTLFYIGILTFIYYFFELKMYVLGLRTKNMSYYKGMKLGDNLYKKNYSKEGCFLNGVEVKNTF